MSPISLALASNQSCELEHLEVLGDDRRSDAQDFGHPGHALGVLPLQEFDDPDAGFDADDLELFGPFAGPAPPPFQCSLKYDIVCAGLSRAFAEIP